MASYPITTNVTIDFSNGAPFGVPFQIGLGQLGYNILSDTTSLIVDVSSKVLSANLRGGYNLLQDQFEVGTGTFRIVDPNGDFNPQNTASPYYGKLLPLRKIRMTATYNGTVYYLFSGYITSWLYTYPKDQNIGYVDITSEDGFRIMNMANISTVTGATAGETTGSRIGKILDTISWPNSMRQIDTGNSLVQADPATQRQALNALKNVEASEQGAFYVDGAGNARFIGRQNLEKKAGVAPTVFSNTPTVSGIGYWQLVLANDDKLIINGANIQAIGGTTQSYTDATSVATYFPHTFNMNNLVVINDAEANNIARAYVATRKDTTLRIDAITLDFTTPNYDAGITAGLVADYFDQWRIVNDAQGNGSVVTDKTLQIVGFAHDITPNTWKATFTTSEPIIDSFIVGSSLYGIIGTSVMTY